MTTSQFTSCNVCRPACPALRVGLEHRRRTSRVARAIGGGGGAAAPEAGASGGATPLNGSQQSGRLEHMDTVMVHSEAPRQYVALDLAEAELGDCCRRLPADANVDKCWQAYSFLERKREAAAASCEGGAAGAFCEDLDHLNDMAHQLLSTGSVEDLVATFSTLARVEEHRAARAAKQQATPDGAGGVAGAGAGAAAEQQADPLHALFSRMDTDGDGRISVAQFRQGMAMLGDELDGASVSLALDAMDVRGGFLEEHQFRDIVEAERLNSKSQVATLWRHHLPGGHPRV